MRFLKNVRLIVKNFPQVQCSIVRNMTMNRKRASNVVVLVDMDCVICDFEGYFLQCYTKMYPGEPYIPLEERNQFYLTEQYSELGEEYGNKAKSIFSSEGFFQNIPPIPNAVDSLKEMSGIDGVSIFLCTSPMRSYKYCAVEKFQWVEEYFGRSWIDKLILTRDKTVVYGNLLIDDKPRIYGALKPPTWDHVLFRACHNTSIKIPSRNTSAKSVLESWSHDWKSLIDNKKKELC